MTLRAAVARAKRENALHPGATSSDSNNCASYPATHAPLVRARWLTESVYR